MSTIWSQIRIFLNDLYFPKIQAIDIVEILILAFLIYIFMEWIQRTRAYTLLKGILIVVLFILVATIFQMAAILWITQRLASVALLALVIIFQPELRKALEQLGNKSLLSSVFLFENAGEKGERFSDRTISEIVRAVNEMSEVRTGALIYGQAAIDAQAIQDSDVFLGDYMFTFDVTTTPLAKSLTVTVNWVNDGYATYFAEAETDMASDYD